MLKKEMVGEEGVTLSHKINSLSKGEGETSPLTAKEDFQRCPHPARYEIICPDGTTTGNFASAREAAFSGEATWPDQKLGEGWDIQRRVQVVGA